MSELRVTTEKVSKVEAHPNADRLDIIEVLGWNCVVSRGSMHVGDLVVYFPIDTVLSDKLNEILFSGGSIKLSGGRIKTIKLRGAISQGLAVPMPTLQEHFPDIKFKDGVNIADQLGVTKYEPKPVHGCSAMSGMKQVSKKNTNPNFHKYTDINHGKNYPSVLDGQMVVITEKIHGTSWRVGYVPISGNWFQKIMKTIRGFFRGTNRFTGYEFIVGSHNVQLQSCSAKKTFYKDEKKSVYHQMADKYDLKNHLKAGETLYGEIYGDGIQKGYSYGLNKEIDAVAFDMMKDGKYMTYYDATERFGEIGIPIVPELYIGLWGSELINAYVSGNSILCYEQKVREGFVVKPIEEKKGHMGRMIFKFINPAYLLKEADTETDFAH